MPLTNQILVYPIIAEGIDEDSSGFVSVHEVHSGPILVFGLLTVGQVDNFIKSKPRNINCSVAQWFAL
jgi:hypothetical protein